MPSFKKFTGNYPQVIDAIHLPASFYSNNGSRKTYNEQVEKDLPRFNYLNYNGNVDSMKKRLADTSHLKDEELAYTQGNFYAGVFTESSVKTHPAFIDTTMKAMQEGTLENYMKSLAFTYVDDEGNACGLSITYLRDDSDQSIPVEKRPLPFTVAVIKNVNKAPADREVTYFTHNTLTPKDAVGGQELEASNLPKELAKAINCQSVNQLLTGIINKDSITLDPFLKLDDRLVCGQNIDDRDTKLGKLFDLFVMWARLAADQKQSEAKTKLMQELTTIINKAYQDVDYFKDKSLEDVENIVSSYQENPLIYSLPPIKNTGAVKQSLMQVVQSYQVNTTAAKAQLNKEIEKYALEHGYPDSADIKTKLEQSFFRRNVGNLLLIGIALLAVVSLVLTLTGVFAPIGLTIGAGLGSALAIAGTCVAGLAAVERAAKIASNESQIKEVKDIINTHDETVQQPHEKHYAEKLAKVVKSVEPDAPKKIDEHTHTDQTQLEKPARLRAASVDSLSLGKSSFTTFGRHKSKSESDIHSLTEEHTQEKSSSHTR